MFQQLPVASPVLYWGFVLLPIVVMGAVILGIRRTSGAATGRRAFIIGGLDGPHWICGLGRLSR